MNGNQDITYSLHFRDGKFEHKENAVASLQAEVAWLVIPRIARLMALAIRFDGMLREEAIQDYAQLARLGRVTRARVTQIMKLLNLAPDIQEQILFLPPIRGLNERNLRPVVSRIDWREQRRLFQELCHSNNRRIDLPAANHPINSCDEPGRTGTEKSPPQ